MTKTTTYCPSCNSPTKSVMKVAEAKMYYVSTYDELKAKSDKLESLLQSIGYAMSADGIKDEKFYLNLGSAIEQTLKDYEGTK